MTTKITTICKECGKKMRRPVVPIAKLMYCSNNCWEKHWKKRGYGLMHPDHPDAVKYSTYVAGYEIIMERIRKREVLPYVKISKAMAKH